MNSFQFLNVHYFVSGLSSPGRLLICAKQTGNFFSGYFFHFLEGQGDAYIVIIGAKSLYTDDRANEQQLVFVVEVGVYLNP